MQFFHCIPLYCSNISCNRCINISLIPHDKGNNTLPPIRLNLNICVCSIHEKFNNLLQWIESRCYIRFFFMLQDFWCQKLLNMSSAHMVSAINYLESILASVSAWPHHAQTSSNTQYTIMKVKSMSCFIYNVLYFFKYRMQVEVYINYIGFYR